MPALVTGDVSTPSFSPSGSFAVFGSVKLAELAAVFTLNRRRHY